MHVVVLIIKGTQKGQIKKEKMEEEIKMCLEMKREIGGKRLCEVENTRTTERERERKRRGSVFRNDNPL